MSNLSPLSHSFRLSKIANKKRTFGQFFAKRSDEGFAEGGTVEDFQQSQLGVQPEVAQQCPFHRGDPIRFTSAEVTVRVLPNKSILHVKNASHRP